MQKTLKNIAEFTGIGLHSGKEISLRVMPAPIGFGIRFFRVDLPQNMQEIPARYDLVSDTRLNTRITNAHNASVSTIEHLMAAIAGFGLTNLRIEVDAPEVPIMDGSALPFVQKFWKIGVEEQGAPSTLFKVVRNVRVDGDHGAFAALSPSDDFILDVSIDFADPAIGEQQLELNMKNGVFMRELANCRTFGRYFEVQTLHKNGLALGGSLENAIVVDDGKVLNPEGFRRSDECVRHKMLDALGDLYVAGGSILGTYRGHLSGHALTNQLLREAFAQGALLKVSSRVSQGAEPRLPGYALEASDFASA